MVSIPEEEVDHHAPLSSEALVILLMKYCNNQIRENAKIERDYSKELTNDKLEIVTKGFGEGIATLAESFNQGISSLHSKVTEVELRLETFNSYFEQLSNSLSNSVQTVTGAFNNHVKLCHVDITTHPCHVCGEVFQTKDYLSSHLFNHTIPSTQQTNPVISQNATDVRVTNTSNGNSTTLAVACCEHDPCNKTQQNAEKP